MNMNKIFIYLTLAILLVSGAFAIKPGTTFEVSSGDLTIISGHPELMRYHATGSELYFHVYNSTGALLNNSRSNCTIHFYNVTNGQHLSEEVLSKHATTEWEYKINWSKLEAKGAYTYIVDCQTVGITPIENGFYRGEVVFTSTGEYIVYEDYLLGAILILLPLLVAWLILHWALALGDEHTVLKIFASLFSMMSIIFSYTIAILNVNKFFYWSEMNNMLNIALTTMAILTLVVLTYWCIYLFQLAIKALAEAKAERLRY